MPGIVGVVDSKQATIDALPNVDLSPFERFLATTAQATNETQKREAFITLAATGFDDSQFATELALGAEYRVNFAKGGLIRRGLIDSFYQNLVIEFENDLMRTREHALDQLRGYIAGAWREEGCTQRPFLAVATDGENWEVFAPSLGASTQNIDANQVILEMTDSWKRLDSEGAASLRLFLNRLFFRKELIAPTVQNVARDFGVDSPAYIAVRNELRACLTELATDSQLIVLRDAWERSLQFAYGQLSADDNLFINHTYLAVFARLLVWASFEKQHLKPQDLDAVLDGRYFVGKRLANFVEEDFFNWWNSEKTESSEHLWVAVSRHLAGYDLSLITEDILKPLYEQLVDPQTRHDLGEFYTPDWLADTVCEHLLKGWDWRLGVPSILDPACGSGTFLRATIHQIKARLSAAKPADLLNDLLARVVGIDVHPLAAIISKATYVLAVRDLVGKGRKPMTIPVFLASSLRTANQGAQDLPMFGHETLVIDGVSYEVPPSFLHDGPAYDSAIDNIVSVAKGFGHSNGNLEDIGHSLRNRLGGNLGLYEDVEGLTDTLVRMTRHIAELVRARRDTVHGFLLKNFHRPVILRNSFDFVVGNPPWLTLSAIKMPEYQRTVVDIAITSKIAPRSAGEQAHTELGTLFLSQAASEYLNNRNLTKHSRIAMILPRSILTATQHRLLREGAYGSPFEVDELWDLDGVTPLFGVPSCVLFARKDTPTGRRLFPGRIFKGRGVTPANRSR